MGDIGIEDNMVHRALSMVEEDEFEYENSFSIKNT